MPRPIDDLCEELMDASLVSEWTPLSSGIKVWRSNDKAKYRWLFPLRIHKAFVYAIQNSGTPWVICWCADNPTPQKMQALRDLMEVKYK